MMPKKNMSYPRGHLFPQITHASILNGSCERKAVVLPYLRACSLPAEPGGRTEPVLCLPAGRHPQRTLHTSERPPARGTEHLPDHYSWLLVFVEVGLLKSSFVKLFIVPYLLFFYHSGLWVTTIYNHMHVYPDQKVSHQFSPLRGYIALADRETVTTLATSQPPQAILKISRFPAIGSLLDHAKSFPCWSTAAPVTRLTSASNLRSRARAEAARAELGSITISEDGRS